MKLHEALAEATRNLTAAFSQTARSEALEIFSRTLNLSLPELMSQTQRELSIVEHEKIQSVLKRRVSGEPLQYILGWEEFLGLRLQVGPGVLIPRLDSEAMVLAGVEHLKQLRLEKPRVLDLGAGSGALGFAVVKRIPGSELVSAESSPQALEFLSQNRKLLDLRAHIQIREIDLDREEGFALEGAYDLILANPPYVDRNDPDLEPQVRRFEPEAALFAAQRGLEKIFRWSQKAMSLLSSKGLYLCEMGWKQGADVKAWFRNSGDENFELNLHQDLSGKDRYFSIRRKDSTWTK